MSEVLDSIPKTANNNNNNNNKSENNFIVFIIQSLIPMEFMFVCVLGGHLCLVFLSMESQFLSATFIG
jgi:hypothetical protein